MTDSSKVGHRQRLRDRFAAGELNSRTDEALLELLLSYGIPQKDVQPLAQELLHTFGSLAAVLAADLQTLCQFNGLGPQSAILLELVDWIQTHYHSAPNGAPPAESVQLKDIMAGLSREAEPEPQTRVRAVRTGLFGKAVLKEAIEILPRLPDTDSLDEVREFLRRNLHFSAEQTRQRNASYIMRRMFPEGYADRALRTFAKRYAGRQELREVCFYRFCTVETLMLDLTHDLLLPAIGRGRLSREQLRSYLFHHFPTSKSINDSGQAILDALTAGGIASADRTSFSFAYRELLLPSFAFILHSEFPEPGIYDLGKLENNRVIQAMLWNPDRLLPSLYELRNQNLIARVSEIDSVRQFTIRWTLEEVVAKINVIKLTAS